MKMFVRKNQAKMKFAFLSWHSWMMEDRAREIELKALQDEALHRVVDILNPIYLGHGRDFLDGLKEVETEYETKRRTIMKIIEASRGRKALYFKVWQMASAKIGYVRNSGAA